VYVGPLSVIRADEIDADGKVHPVIIEEGSLIQDGVIIHARAGTVVRIGERANIAHGVIIHGPCEIQRDCFVSLRAAIYSSTLEEGVWVGIGSIIMRTTIPSHTMIPAGSLVRSNADIRAFRITDVKEETYRKDVFGASTVLRESYKKLYGSTQS
jgi:carbonic anhydrase/acetyltransferase-like protein (isoleucine patch superfamily)